MGVGERRGVGMGVNAGRGRAVVADGRGVAGAVAGVEVSVTGGTAGVPVGVACT